MFDCFLYPFRSLSFAAVLETNPMSIAFSPRPQKPTHKHALPFVHASPRQKYMRNE